MCIEKFKEKRKEKFQEKNIKIIKVKLQETFVEQFKSLILIAVIDVYSDSAAFIVGTEASSFEFLD